MTSTQQAADADVPGPARSVAVSTHAIDTLRASVDVEGVLDDHTVPLLVDVARTHLDAGRRYLRINLATATVRGAGAVSALVGLHDRVTALGGSLVFEHPDRTTSALLNAADLLVGPPRDV